MKDTKIFAVIFLTSVDKQLFFPNPIVLYGNVNFLMRFRFINFPLLSLSAVRILIKQKLIFHNLKQSNLS